MKFLSKATNNDGLDSLDVLKVTDGSMNAMSDGSEFVISDKEWAAVSTGGPSFFCIKPEGGTTRSVQGSNEVFGIKSSSSSDTQVTFRNADGTGANMDILLRSEKDTSLRMWSGASVAGLNETARIQSTETGNRLDIINYDHGNMHIVGSGDADAAISFYFGNGTGTTGNYSNPKTNHAMQLRDNTLRMSSTNSAAVPNFSFIDDDDTGMYLVATGQTGFSSAGSLTMTVPTSVGTNGYVLTTNGAGVASWAAGGGGGTTYSAGTGLDLTSTTFSIEPDLRDGITHVGLDAGDYIGFTNNSQIDFFVNGGNEMRLEADGDLHVDGDVIAFSSTISDARLKKDVEPILSASKKVSLLNGVEYTWKAGSRAGQREIGLIAQEVEEVIPSIVREKKLPLQTDMIEESYKTVDYEKLVALLIEAHKEQADIIDQLEERVIHLENIA